LLRHPFHQRTEFTIKEKLNDVSHAGSRAHVWPEFVMGTSSIGALAQPTLPSIATSGAAEALSSGDFLSLLVGELENQDPLDPTSTTDLINQMGTYANFDQEQSLNTQLGTLLGSFNSLLTLNAVNYIGHTVEVKGNTATLKNGDVDYGYYLNSAATSAQITITDSSGNAVWTGAGATGAGLNPFTWNGKDSNGNQLPDGGQYTISVTAKDGSGNTIAGYTTFTGVVDDVDSSSGTTELDVDGVPAGLSDIVGVKS
jgi:flagellar basal-body rod modification protein FlgD